MRKESIYADNSNQLGERMLKRIKLRNFRAFKTLDIELSKINLLFGPNNSGKSAIISSMNVIAQTLESADPVVPLLLVGSRVDLGTYRDAVYNNHPELPITFGFEFTSSDPLESSRNVYVELTYAYRKRQREIVLDKAILNVSGRKNNFELASTRTSSGNSHTGIITVRKPGKRSMRYKAKFNFFHLTPFMPMVHGPQSPSHRPLDEAYFTIRRGMFSFSRELSRIEYIGPFREYPARTFMFSGEHPRSAGKQGERAVNILVSNYMRGGKRGKRYVRQVSRWLRSGGIARRLAVDIISDRHFEVKVVHSRTGESENLADVGFGCGQILPVLASGYNLPRGSIFIVEQPEIHLHPKAQAELGSFFYELCRSGVQSIVETHSEHLLLRLQSYVANGMLKPDDLKIYYVHANERGKKEAIEMRVGADGFIDTVWPGGFFPERLEEARKIAKGRTGETS